MKIGEKIKILREKNKLTQEEVAKQLKTTKQTIYKYENGIVTNIPSDKIESLSKILKCSPSYLMGWNDNNENHSELNKNKLIKGVKIPILGYVSAGIPIEEITDILDYEEITESLANTGLFFGLKIKGTSMEPKICDGDVVIVKAQSDIDNGEICIVSVENREATCKKLLKNENGIQLVGFNPNFNPLFFTPEQINALPVSVIGKVIELRRKF